MKLKICLLLFLCPFFRGLSQEITTSSTGTTGLLAGDRLPNVTVKVLDSAGGNTGLRLGDYRDRLLLLDFWSTSCGSCIQSLPELIALQTQFGKALKIVLVDYERPERILAFFRNNRGAGRGGLPVVYSDTLLKRLFVHQFIPHVAWVYQGVLKTTTGAEQVNADNIKRMLQGSEVAGGRKEDVIGYDYSIPLFTCQADSRLGVVPLHWTSVLSGYIPGLPLSAGKTVDSAKRSRRFYAINHSLLHLYALALQSGLPLRANRRVLDTGDWVYDAAKGYYADWAASHCFSYELTCPLGTPEAVERAGMKADLDRFSGWTAAIEIRRVSCLVLRRTAADAGRELHHAAPSGNNGIYAADLAYRLDRLPGFPPVLQDADGRERIALDLKDPPKTIAGWTQLLAGAGWSLESQEREIPLFVCRAQERGN